MRKRVLNIVLAVVMLATVFPVTGYAAGTTYKNINLNSKFVDNYGIGQHGESTCAIASMATVEAYLLGITSPKDKDTVYNAVLKKNGAPRDGQWTKMGYSSIKSTESFSLVTLYNQLAKGRPVIVFRSGKNQNHYSVVYAYTGSTTQLEIKGFQVCNVGRYGRNKKGIDPDTPTVEQQNLSTWKGNSTLTQIVYRNNSTPMTISELSRYTVSYNANGGSVSPASASVEKGKTVTLPKPTRTGATFLGWYTAASGGTKVGTNGTNYKPTASVTLYAHWDGVAISNASATVRTGSRILLTANALSSGKKVTWSSSNTSVATVSAYGPSYAIVTTKKAGTVNITAAVSGTSFKSVCKVIVSGSKPLVSFSYTKAVAQSDGSYTLYSKFNSAGNKSTECGMYISTLNLANAKKLGSDKVSVKTTTMYYNTKKYNYSLTKGTTYYYLPYVVIDGVTYVSSNINSFRVK